MKVKKLKAPFPYFGGKSKVAALVWERFGDVRNAIEPFCGTLAWMLLRPHAPQIETVNDANCFIANFWRAVQADPEAVVDHCNFPVNEADLHAWHRYLVLTPQAAAFRFMVRSDPKYFDPEIAGRWVWGQCQWIGGGWCMDNPAVATPETNKRPGLSVSSMYSGVCSQKKPKLSSNGVGAGVHAGNGLKNQMPDISGDSGCTGRGMLSSNWSQRPEINDGGRGVHGTTAEERKRPILGDSRGGDGSKGVHAGRPQLGDAFSRGRGVNSNDLAETCEARRAWLLEWFGRLQDRLRPVRVCCGDWIRVCGSRSVTTRIGMTGIFFDPPYKVKIDGKKSRAAALYGTEGHTVADDVRAYCVKHGNNPMLRIALCGLEGEHNELEEHGWDKHAWKAQGGYGNRRKGNDNNERERIWFSPHCIKPQTSLGGLFKNQEHE